MQSLEVEFLKVWVSVSVENKSWDVAKRESDG
jgi:hypothetical protein